METIFIVLVFLLSKGASVASEKYDKTTKCIYTTVDGVEMFEFVCEPNKGLKDYFKDSIPISCESDYGYVFYKERRNKIQFRNCYRRQLPIIFAWYKALRVLNVTSLGLESLRSKNFDYAKNLVELIASHNEITEIPSSLFDDANKLSVVDVSYNRINRIDPFAFDADNEITLLNLSHNLIAEIDNRTLVHLTGLEVLDLSWNRVTDIQDGLFDGLSQLRNLILANNRLQRMECSVFAYVTNLKMLDLRQNQLTVFDANCVQSETTFALLIENNEINDLTLTRNVSEINAAGNNISRIIVEGDLGSMTVFNISTNEVENVLDLMNLLNSSLRILDVSDSLVGKLNISTFERFDNLVRLSLRNTKLSNIQFGTFHHQQKLRFLDLSDNDLNKINFEMLHWNSDKLEVLYLDGNDLDDLSNLTRTNYPFLEYVSIDDNNFDCHYLSGIQRMWKREGISVVSNPRIISERSSTDTHVNGITCYHGSEDSKLVIVEKQEVESAGIHLAATSVTESVSMGKVEALLVCIFIALICILTVILVKNVVPIFQRKDVTRVERPRIEEMSLI